MSVCAWSIVLLLGRLDRSMLDLVLMFALDAPCLPYVTQGVVRNNIPLALEEGFLS